MKMYREILEIETHRPDEFIDVTKKVEMIVKKSKISKGMCFINSLHNTAAIFVQENDEDIFKDTKKLFEKILPLNGSYHHDYEGNINATAHQKTNLIGSSVTLPVENGRLMLGTWQRIIFAEWFEKRDRKIVITVIGD